MNLDRSKFKIIVLGPSLPKVESVLSMISIDPNYEIINLSTFDDLRECLRTFSSCMLVASISGNSHIPDLIRLMKEFESGVKSGSIKTLFVSKLKNPQLGSIFSGLGTNDYMEDSVPEKTILFKAKLLLKSIEHRNAVVESRAAADETILFKRNEEIIERFESKMIQKTKEVAPNSDTESPRITKKPGTEGQAESLKEIFQNKANRESEEKAEGFTREESNTNHQPSFIERISKSLKQKTKNVSLFLKKEEKGIFNTKTTQTHLKNIAPGFSTVEIFVIISDALGKSKSLSDIFDNLAGALELSFPNTIPVIAAGSPEAGGAIPLKPILFRGTLPETNDLWPYDPSCFPIHGISDSGLAPPFYLYLIPKADRTDFSDFELDEIKKIALLCGSLNDLSKEKGKRVA